MSGGLNADDLPLERIFRWERERPQSVFLTQPLGGGKIREWTWAQAVAEIRRIAHWLMSQGWEPGSRVAILSKNCAWWILADAAIWMAGHVSVPIFPSHRPQSIRKILEHCEAKACFLGATEEMDDDDSGIPPNVVTVCLPTAGYASGPTWEGLVATCPPVDGCPVRPPDHLSTIIYTSGTTGNPKGVMHRFAGCAYDAKVLSHRVGLNSETRVLSYLPLAHIVERVMEGTAFYCGFHIYFAERIETFLSDLERAKPTVFLSVPRLLLKFQQGVFAKIREDRLARLLRIPLLNRPVRKNILRKLGLQNVVSAASGAAPLPPETLLWYRSLGLNLMEGYGMTETWVTHLPVPGSVRAGFVGSAVEGVEAKLDEHHELLIRSPMNMLGYYKDPEATRASFTEDGFFRTGDLARIDMDGQLQIVGRLKEQFKTSKGKYVAPAPIESQLLAHPVVEACCLMGAGLPRPFAVVLLAEETRKAVRQASERATVEHTLQDLLKNVNSHLDPHEQLGFVAVAEGPWTVSNGFVTPTLKIKRNVLEHRYQPCAEEWMRQNRAVVWEATSGGAAMVSS